MALTSSVPKIEFTEAGIILPAENEILTGVQTDMDAAFGGGLNSALETPQGQLASSQTAIIADKNNEIATIVNQIDPQYADGRFQDAIGRIYFLMRKPATPTIVLCTLIGLPNTVIPSGTLAQDTNNNTYRCVDNITIPMSSTISNVEFENIETGNIPCAANTLIRVYQTIIGWDSINNPSDGIEGNVVESRLDFEYRRKNSVALNGRSSIDSIYAAVFNIPNVIDVYATENVTSDIINVGSTSYPLLPHSLYVAVLGGIDADIANVIWTKKDLGCDYNGNTTVTIIDTSYNVPQPTYNIKFERPSSLPVLFSVSIVDDTNLPYNASDLIKLAIINKFDEERIGATVYASKYYAPVAAVSIHVAILNILIGIVSATLTSVLPGIDQIPTISADDIEVILI